MPLPLPEAFNLGNCFWFENENKRNATAAILAGVFFFTGWWLMIDATAVYPESVSGAYHICGIVGTISMFMINIVSQSQMHGDYSSGYFGAHGPRVWLFIAFVLGFASVIASCWIFFADFVGKTEHIWSGVALMLQNIFIFIGSLLYKFGRIEEHW